MAKKYKYAVFIESDRYDEERERLFYEGGYHYEWFDTLKEAKNYARKCKNEIKELMKKGDVVFDCDSTITMDVERYDDWEDDEDIDYDTRQLVFTLYLQGRY